jgi:hypothetical protein
MGRLKGSIFRPPRRGDGHGDRSQVTSADIGPPLKMVFGAISAPMTVVVGAASSRHALRLPSQRRGPSSEPLFRKFRRLLIAPNASTQTDLTSGVDHGPGRPCDWFQCRPRVSPISRRIGVNLTTIGLGDGWCRVGFGTERRAWIRQGRTLIDLFGALSYASGQNERCGRSTVGPNWLRTQTFLKNNERSRFSN